jgi:hypothetical protein
MGRSVSTPANAYLVAYCDWFNPTDEEGNPENREPENYDWDDYVEGVVEYAKELWPSLSSCGDRVWLGREDRALLENNLVYLGVSEYCGLAAVWVVPKDGDYEHLATRWCNQISAKFDKAFASLRKLGTMSNGEGVYQRVER